MSNNILNTFKETIRKPYAWPGGYTIALYLSDGERICAPCARDEWRLIVGDTIDGYGSWQAGFAGVYWEGPSQLCCHCNEPQDSEYGDPDADEVTA
mgnify:FL=1|tara:strand:+ start:167 stop:454 length:288 start_codon:yes stop_codon:yes gene_type:complete